MTPEQLKQKSFEEIFKKKMTNLIRRNGSQMKRKRNPPHPLKCLQDSESDLSTQDEEVSDTQAFETHNIVNETIDDEENSSQAEDDTSEENSVHEIESHLVNREQYIAQENKLITTNFEVKVEN